MTFWTAPKTENKALTTILRFSYLLITLKGRNALKALIALRNENLDLMLKRYMATSMQEIKTTKQSILFHPEAMYGSIFMYGFFFVCS